MRYMKKYFRDLLKLLKQLSFQIAFLDTYLKITAPLHHQKKRTTEMKTVYRFPF